MVTVENNYTGQFRRLIQRETGIEMDKRYCGTTGGRSRRKTSWRPEGGELTWK